MPPPASRRSPSRELRSENHRRGRSLEGGLALKDKDDDLALFSELQSREREDFLVQPVDDFEDAFTTKLRHFSDYKVGITIPARGESSDLLNADGEKNDYEWLITPPDTPLFPSLDDEPALVDAPLRGRQRTQPVSISRSSTMEKSYRSSRGSASPSRSSLSPRSGNSTSQSRSKPSSAPHTSPVSNMRSPTPTRRASPSPIKRSSPTPRSPSPLPRRMSTGSNASPAGPSGVRRMSPGKTTRGNSSSPKIKAWQANIPGFSCDVPPNLRTSLEDRPASYVRGSSPASRNGRESPSKTNRQSISPTASRSVSSLSISHDRDWLSSHSKGSVASSGDDEVDSVHSVSVGTLDQSTPRKVGAHANSSRSMALSRKQAKLSASAPKRSFDAVLRQMDNRKAPQNMFRPLLSSVPSTTFYSGKPSSAHSIISRHSSVTTSSNTSSDQGTTLLPDPEGSYYNQGTVVVESSRALPPDVQDEVFVFDKEDGAELGNEIHFEENDLDKGHKIDTDQIYSGNHSPSKSFDSMCDPAHVNDDLCEVDHGPTQVCSLCGCIYDAADDMEMDMNLCRECLVKDEISHVIIPVTPPIVADESSIASVEIPEERLELDDSRSSATISGSTSTDQSNLGEIKLSGTSPSLPMVEIHDQVTESGKSTRVTDAASAGISLLLKRSGSSKGIVVQGRTLTASTISYDDLSYARDSLRSSIGHRSVSSSSSIDLTSSRQTDMRILRQLSCKKFETENFRDEVNSQNAVSSISGITSYGNTDSEVSKERAAASQSNEADTDFLPSVGDAVTQEHESEVDVSGLKVDSSTSEMAIHIADVRSEANSMATLEGNVEELEESIRNATDMEDLSVITEFPGTENAPSDPCGSALECSDGSAPVNGSLVAKPETEGSNGHENMYMFEVNEVSPDLNDTTDEHEDPSKKDVEASTPETSPSDQVLDIQEESTVTVETRKGTRSRSLTLDEATDTILFCSSIVHDLAYNAAAIAMEKQDQEPFEEGFRPTVTIVGGPTPDRNDPRRGRIVSKRGLRLHKARPKRLDTDRKILSSKTENDENIDESLTRNVGVPHKLDSEKPPRLESKCNCTIM